MCMNMINREQCININYSVFNLVFILRLSISNRLLLMCSFQAEYFLLYPLMHSNLIIHHVDFKIKMFDCKFKHYNVP